MTSLLEDRVDILANDQPKLDAALKNLLSFALAEAKASGGTPQQLQETARSAQAAARSISIAINGLQMPAAPQWGLKNPQGENESAVDRMESLARYKAAHAMHDKLRQAGPECKTTKYFGRIFVEDTRVWPEVKAEAENQIPEWISNPGSARDLYLSFLKDFEAGLSGARKPSGSEPAARAVDESDRSEEALAEILWSNDMAATLKARMERRMARVGDRNKREESNQNDAYAQAVRQATTGALEGQQSEG